MSKSVIERAVESGNQFARRVNHIERLWRKWESATRLSQAFGDEFAIRRDILANELELMISYSTSH